ncbi:MAG TPA: patatin-like phospholipase family protein [Jatrophihabitantaceae bacterium]|nr:patatin-like phospholipase family protein [Jatrophihabitantaceae bacterium]
MTARDKLAAAAAAGEAPAPAADAPRRAIVCGAGGVLGFAWLLGALSALEEVAGFDAREVDVVVGTSAGSVAAGLLGCGIPIEVICRHHQGVPAPDDPAIMYDYETGVGGGMPPRPGWRPGSPRMLLDRLRGRTRIPAIVALTGLLPTGRGTLSAVHGLIGEVANEAGFADNWPTRPRPWIVTADYRTGQRVVFGRDDFVSRKGQPSRVVRRAKLADAVTASCSIPGWYPPTVIDGVPYIDGGASSNASVDVLLGTAVEEVYVLAPMASVDVDRAHTFIGKLERAVRRAITKTILADVAKLRAAGVRVYVLTPEPADLTAMGVNLMNPENRNVVLETAQRTAAEQLRRQLAGRRAAERRAAATGSAGKSSA